MARGSSYDDDDDISSLASSRSSMHHGNIGDEDTSIVDDREDVPRIRRSSSKIHPGNPPVEKSPVRRSPVGGPPLKPKSQKSYKLLFMIFFLGGVLCGMVLLKVIEVGPVVLQWIGSLIGLTISFLEPQPNANVVVSLGTIFLVILTVFGIFFTIERRKKSS